MTATLELSKQLIARRSVTPADDGCQALISERLLRVGFKAEIIASNGVTNTWLRWGTPAPLIAFAGHTDVVPTGPRERWASDPFEPEIRDGMLFGRGAADMKSSVAAFVVAAEEFIGARDATAGVGRGSIALLLTSDEEGPATDGTVKVVDLLRARGESIDYCIVGEPTCVSVLGDTIKNGRRGSLSGKLTVVGIQGHVAYPLLVRNPVHQAAPALAELAVERWDDGNEFFPATTFQISNIRAGTGALNVVPGTCEVDFNLRFASVSTAAGLMQRIESILRKHGLEFSVQWTVGAQPFLTPPGDLSASVTRAIREVTGHSAQLSTTGGTSDGRFISTFCPQVIEFGPPNGSIHKIDEHIALADLDPLKNVYRRTLELLLS